MGSTASSTQTQAAARARRASTPRRSPTPAACARTECPTSPTRSRSVAESRSPAPRRGSTRSRRLFVSAQRVLQASAAGRRRSTRAGQQQALARMLHVSQCMRRARHSRGSPIRRLLPRPAGPATARSEATAPRGWRSPTRSTCDRRRSSGRRPRASFEISKERVRRVVSSGSNAAVVTPCRLAAAGGGMRRLAGESCRAARLDRDAEHPSSRARHVGATERRGRLRPLHALQGGAELARPQQQRSVRQVQAHDAATRGRRCHRSRRRRVPATTCSRTAAADRTRPGCGRRECLGCGSPGACAATASRTSPTPAVTAASPTLPRVGINQGSPKFEAANQACGKYRPPYIPSNAAYNSYARTHG